MPYNTPDGQVTEHTPVLDPDGPTLRHVWDELHLVQTMLADAIDGHASLRTALSDHALVTTQAAEAALSVNVEAQTTAQNLAGVIAAAGNTLKMIEQRLTSAHGYPER